MRDLEINMTPSAFHHNDPRLVLLVAGSGRRRDALRRCVWARLPGCRIEMADSYFDAMAQASHLPEHLLILDLSLDSVLVPALLRYLADAAPQAQVHVFDDSRDPLGENGQPALRDDSPAMALLRESLLAFAGGRPVARAQRPLSGGDGAHT